MMQIVLIQGCKAPLGSSGVPTNLEGEYGESGVILSDMRFLAVKLFHLNHWNFHKN